MLDVIDLNIEFHDHLIPETVVYDFDLHMDEGEIVGIVGESGSGKSMSAMSIAGLLSRKDMKKSGSIFFDGTDMLNCPRFELRKIQGKDIGIVFQEPMNSLNPCMKIGKQVEEALYLHGVSDEQKLKFEAISILDKCELKDTERIYNSYPHELSGGQRQRVMLAAALICKPKLLIADEITTALDVTVQASIIELLKQINKTDNTAILFISHDLNLVRKLCKRVLVMQKGRVVESGDVEKIFNNPICEYTKMLLNSIPKMEKFRP